MTVAAIIPVWNGANYLAQAVESVLSQTRAADEILVVDDGSTDDTPVVAKRFPQVRYLRQENQGPGPTRNLGLRESQSELVSFLDHDDVWLPSKLAQQLECLSESPEADGVFGWTENFISEDLSPEERLRIQCSSAPSKGIAASVLMVRRSVFDRVGFWPATQREGVDWLHLARSSGVQFRELRTVVARRRLHLTNRTRIGSDHNRDYLRIARESLHRARGNGSLKPLISRTGIPAPTET